MKYRDSSNKTTHFESDVLAGARAANENAVRIYGNSSGTTNYVGIEAVGDSTVVNLDIKAKGTGGIVRIGSGSSGGLVLPGPITLGSTVVTNSSAASAQAVRGVFKSTLAFEQAAISSGALVELTVASTTADVQPGDLVTYRIDWAAQDTVIDGGHRMSTAAASRLTLVLANPGSTATATLSGVVTITWLDLT